MRRMLAWLCAVPWLCATLVPFGPATATLLPSTGTEPPRSSIPPADPPARQTPKPPPALVRETVLPLVRDVPCAVLDVSVSQGRIRVTGDAERGAALDRALERLGGLDGAGAVTADVRPLPRAFCRPVEALAGPVRRNRESGPGLTVRTVRATVGTGDPILLDVETPAGDHHLTVDLYLSDGSVRHLMPARGTTAGRPLGGGTRRLGERPAWIAAAPSGRHLVAVIASPSPLELDRRNEVEDADGYLAALDRVLRTYAENDDGEKLLAEFTFLETRDARPIPNEKVIRQEKPPPSQSGNLSKARCSNILARVQLGEPLSDADRAFLRGNC